MNRIPGMSLSALTLVALLGVSAAAQIPANTAYVISNIASTGNGIRGYDAAGAVTTFIPLIRWRMRLHRHGADQRYAAGVGRQRRTSV
jgi:hypothetical protein